MIVRKRFYYFTKVGLAIFNRDIIKARDPTQLYTIVH